MSEWHEKRKQSIGASEVAALLHADWFKGPYDIWLSKTGETDFFSSEAQHWGHLLEDLIADEYRRRTGHGVVDPGRESTAYHPRAPWMSATLDRKLIRPKGGRLQEGALECKFIGDYFTEKWVTGAPIDYAIQLQVQMEVCDLDWGVVAGLVGKEFYAWRYDRNPKVGKLLFQWVEWFWECIEKRERPAWYSPSYLLDAGKIIRRVEQLPRRRVARYAPLAA